MIKRSVFKKGFTLIELIVAILIIGVLAGVALPQYMKSLEKSKCAEAVTILQNIYNAEQRAMIAFNRYFRHFEELDINFSDSSGEDVEGAEMSTPNFDILLEDIDENKGFITAYRVKNGNDMYAIHKDVKTGQLICEDVDTEDNITCELFGFDGSYTRCDDGSMVGPGEECPQEDEPEPDHVCPVDYLWDSLSGKCTHFCPPGKKCKLACPSGYSWNGIECVQ